MADAFRAAVLRTALACLVEALRRRACLVARARVRLADDLRAALFLLAVTAERRRAPLVPPRFAICLRRAARGVLRLAIRSSFRWTDAGPAYLDSFR